jgi:hypothetical protein
LLQFLPADRTFFKLGLQKGQGVQVDSDTARESGIRTGDEVTVAKTISQLLWSKWNIFLPGNAA